MSNLNAADVQATAQRQADTIEALHAAAASYKARADAAESVANARMSEADTVRALQGENANLRAEVFSLTERIRDLEAAISRSAEATSLKAESQAQLGVQVRAYQRHNHFLQGEVSARDAKMRALEDRVEFLQEEVRAKEKRVSLMMDRLRRHNVDMTRLGEGDGGAPAAPGSAAAAPAARVSVPEATLQQIREKMAVQASTIEVLRERLESLEDEAARKEHVLKSLRRENDALKTTISKMVAQISQEVQSSAVDMRIAAEALSRPSNAGQGSVLALSQQIGGRGGSGGGGSPSSSQVDRLLQSSDPTGSSLLLGLGGAATGNSAVANNPTRFLEASEDQERRLQEFRNRRLNDFGAGASTATPQSPASYARGPASSTGRRY